MGTPDKLKVQRYVFLAKFENHEGDELAIRELRIVSQKLSRAAGYAEKATLGGEALVSLAKQNDAVV